MREEFGTPGGVTDLDVKMAKIKAEERADRRDKRMVTSLAFLGLLAVLGIITAIYFGASNSAIRNDKFRMECLKAGGTVNYGQCFSTVPGVEP